MTSWKTLWYWQHNNSNSLQHSTGPAQSRQKTSSFQLLLKTIKWNHSIKTVPFKDFLPIKIHFLHTLFSTVKKLTSLFNLPLYYDQTIAFWDFTGLCLLLKEEKIQFTWQMEQKMGSANVLCHRPFMFLFCGLAHTKKQIFFFVPFFMSPNKKFWKWGLQTEMSAANFHGVFYPHPSG